MTAAPKPWADGPHELISGGKLSRTDDGKTRGCHRQAEEMILIHNLLIRGANSMYLQCENVEREPEATADFVNYCLSWCASVESHHNIEESTMFPAIEKAAGVPGLMGVNTEQHRAFHDGLEGYQRLLQRMLDGGQAAYQGAAIKKALDGFLPALVGHLRDEIETLLALEKHEDKTDWEAWHKELSARIMAVESKHPTVKTVALPFALHHHDKTYEDGAFAWWPELPWLIRVVFQWVFIPKNKTWWRFSPCDDQGNPRELPFAT